LAGTSRLKFFCARVLPKKSLINWAAICDISGYSMRLVPSRGISEPSWRIFSLTHNEEEYIPSLETWWGSCKPRPQRLA
jgi:hypothetical protein